MKVSPYVAKISTLKNGETIILPLNSSKYHVGLLQKADRIGSFQLVWKGSKLYVHAYLEFQVPDQPVNSVRAFDLGVRRAAASVTLRPDGAPKSRDFSILRDGPKREHLNRIRNRKDELRQARQWEALRHLKQKEQNVAAYYDRLFAKRIAAESVGSLVAVGHPQGVKYDNYAGNGKARLRRLLARWSYGREVKDILEECNKIGVPARAPGEARTSRTCHRCGSRHTERPTQSLFHCLDCGLRYNADYNGSWNTGTPFLAVLTSRGHREGKAQTGDERPREIASQEPGSLKVHPPDMKMSKGANF